ncbi:MAG TPA: glucan biosynthesis protein G [Myxococcota bacterium]|nr:glucan biosynthesis protein G [Myxococcota bacterium]
MSRDAARRRWIGALLQVAWLGSMLVGGAARAAGARFGLEQVAEKAQALARAPFHDPHGEVPEWLLGISYDQWRDIRFRPEQALWRGRNSAFEIQFFHPGLYYDRTVAMNVIDAKGVHPVPFSPSQFDYGKNDFASRVPQNLGYAGFRIHFPIKRPDYKDEVIVFLGASYFRAVGRDEAYGLSARGVAVDTALPTGEEFPFFKEYWLVRPAPGAKEIELYALLDSPRLTGAYRFVVTPGEQTLVDVEVRLFLRDRIGRLGVAPLTSMFFFGENTLRQPEDFRPEVHDSDGLLLEDSTGEWIWRPLDNPRTLGVSAFRMTNPRGFGLLQRDRNFDHYQDLETRQDTRPSVWIEPDGEWGPGSVQLVEIPTPADIHDNIVAFWVPEKTPAPGDPIHYAYRMYWYGDDPSRPPAGRVEATRRDRGTYENAHRFVIDFNGKQLAQLPPETVLRGVVSVGPIDAGQAELLEQHVIPNPVTHGWRLTFQVRPKGGDPVELRAFLQRGQDALTETWSYTLKP